MKFKLKWTILLIINIKNLKCIKALSICGEMSILEIVVFYNLFKDVA